MRELVPRVGESVEPRGLDRVKLRFFQCLNEDDQALAQEMIDEGWLFRGWLGLLEPIYWPPPPEELKIVSARLAETQEIPRERDLPTLTSEGEAP